MERFGKGASRDRGRPQRPLVCEAKRRFPPVAVRLGKSGDLEMADVFLAGSCAADSWQRHRNLTRVSNKLTTGLISAFPPCVLLKTNGSERSAILCLLGGAHGQTFGASVRGGERVAHYNTDVHHHASKVDVWQLLLI